MRPPVIAVSPYAVLVAVEDADLPIDRTRGTAIAVAVEGDGLDKVLVAVPDNVKASPLVNAGRIVEEWRCVGHFSCDCDCARTGQDISVVCRGE